MIKTRKYLIFLICALFLFGCDIPLLSTSFNSLSLNTSVNFSTDSSADSSSSATESNTLIRRNGNVTIGQGRHLSSLHADCYIQYEVNKYVPLDSEYVDIDISFGHGRGVLLIWSLNSWAGHYIFSIEELEELEFSITLLDDDLNNILTLLNFDNFYDDEYTVDFISSQIIFNQHFIARLPISLFLMERSQYIIAIDLYHPVTKVSEVSAYVYLQFQVTDDNIKFL